MTIITQHYLKYAFIQKYLRILYHMNSSVYTYHSLVEPDSLDLDQAGVADSLASLCLKRYKQLIFLHLYVFTP